MGFPLVKVPDFITNEASLPSYYGVIDKDVGLLGNIDYGVKQDVHEIRADNPKMSNWKKVGLIAFGILFVWTLPIVYHREIGKGICNVANKTWTHIIKPVGKALGKALKFAFYTVPKFILYDLPKAFYKQVVEPLAMWTWTHIIKPVGEQIKKSLKFLFCTIPALIYQRLLIPVGKRMIEAVVLTYKSVLNLTGNILVQIKKLFDEYVIQPSRNAVRSISESIVEASSSMYRMIVGRIAEINQAQRIVIHDAGAFLRRRMP